MNAGALILVPFGARGAAQVAGHSRLMPLAFGVALLASVVPYSLELSPRAPAPRWAPEAIFRDRGGLRHVRPAADAWATAREVSRVRQSPRVRSE